MATEILYLEAKSDIKGVVKDVDKLNESLKKTKKRISDTEKESKKSNKAIMDLVGNFRIFGVSINQVSRQFQNLIPASKKLFSVIKSGIAATGLGLLVLAVVSLVAAMKNSIAGGKALADVMKVIGSITSTITEALSFLGETILSVFGYDSSVAVTNVQRLEQAYKDLERQMDNLKLKEAEAQITLLENVRIINDVTKTEEERLKASKENAAIQQGIIDEEIAGQEAILLAAIDYHNEMKSWHSWEQKNATKANVWNKVANDNESAFSKSREQSADATTKLRAAEIKLANLRTKSHKAVLSQSDEEVKIKSTNLEKIEKAEQEAATRRAKAKAKAAREALDLENKKIQDEINAKLMLQKIEDELADAVFNHEIDIQKQRLERQKTRDKEEINNSLATKETKDLLLKALDEKYLEDLSKMTTESTERMQELDKEMTLMNFDDTLKNQRLLEDAKLTQQMNSEILSMNSFESSEELKTKVREKYDKIRGKITKKRGEEDVAMAKATTNEQISAFGNLAGALSSLAGDNKELAVASAIIDTYVGANKAFAQGGVVGFIGAAAVIAAGLANVQKIYSTDAGSGGGPGPSPSAEAPTPTMMSGAFELSGTPTGNEPLQAFVVSDDITDSQNGLEIIRRRATI